MRRLTVPALALIGSLGFMSDARAGCCDDFWSCMAAVATAGVSCQVQAIIDTVKSLKQAVDTLSNDLVGHTGDVIRQAQQSTAQAIDDLNKARADAQAAAQQAAQKAHDLATARRDLARVQGLGSTPLPGAPPIANPPAISAPVADKGARTAPMPVAKAADPNAIKDILARADAYASDLQSKADAHQKDVAASVKSAGDALPKHVQAAQQIAVDAALAPLRLLSESLLDLLSHPERIFDPSAQIEADIQRITTEVPAMLAKLTTEVAQEALGLLEHGRPPMQDLQDTAESAKSVADAMQKLADAKTQGDLDALERLLPKQPRDKTIPVRTLLLVPGVSGHREIIAAAFARADTTKLPLVVRHRASVSDIASKWQGIKVRMKAAPTIEPGSQQKVERDLGQMFSGKGKGDVDKKKRELLDEANKRFANDPKTLQKVRQYIESHASG